MSYTFQVTLVGLNADVTAVLGADAEKIDLGQLTLAELQVLAGKLRALDPATTRAADAGIIVRRGEKGWRISNHPGQLRVHHSTSSLDDYWAASSADSLAELPPFRVAATEELAVKQAKFATARRGGPLRTVAEIGGMLVLAVACMAIALYFGTPRRRLSDPPDTVIVVKAPEEVREIFAKVAGVYATGTTKGNSIVTITTDGKVTLAMLDKDGKAREPARLVTQAKAGRKSGVPCVVVPGLGAITVAPPEGVDVNAYRWKHYPNI